MTNNSKLSKLVASASWFGVLVALLLCDSRAAIAQVVVEVVPPEVIATTEPVYYEGHSVYWYNGYWCYRDQWGHWGHYGVEPAFLADRRAHFAPARRYYGGGGYRDHGYAGGGGWGHRR